MFLQHLTAFNFKSYSQVEINLHSKLNCFVGDNGQGKTNFRGASFGKGSKNFNLADFSGSEISFDSVDFGAGNISYNQAVANHISFNACSFNSFVDFRFAKCSLLNLSNSVIRDIVDMVPEKEEVVIKVTVI